MNRKEFVKTSAGFAFFAFFAVFAVLSGGWSIKRPVEKEKHIRANPVKFPKPNLVVAKNGSGDFTTIHAALAAIPENNSKLFVVFIKNGVYKEKILIDKNYVVLMGESREETKIIYSEHKWIWQCKNDPNDPLPAVVNVIGNDCTILNLTIKNNYGELHKDDPLPQLNCNMDFYERRVKPNGHQYAFMLTSNATKLIILNCNIIAAGSDTFCPWNKETGMYYIKDTYFEGYTDMVCPRGDCYITDSKFFNRGGAATIWHDGSASKDKKFVINNSNFDGIKDFQLGRYTNDGRMILVNCAFTRNMADINIKSTKRDNTEWGRRTYYYNCSREGSDYSWYKNNFSEAGDLPDPELITPFWAFNGKWDPKKFINDNNLTAYSK